MSLPSKQIYESSILSARSKDNMKLTAEGIEGFVNAVLKKDFDTPADTPECHREWWRMCCSDHKFVAIAAPRGHAKSTAITISYTLACLLFRQRQFALLVSDTEAQSSFFLNTLKRTIETNEDLKKFFHIKKIDKDTETDFICEFDDGYQFRVIAKGSEQKLRGINWNNKRPDLIVCDDMENDEIVLNQERREKFRNWFSSALLPCRSKHGIVRFVGTILHMDSQLERLMPKQYDRKIVREALKETTGPEYHWYAAKYRAHTEDFSKVLWPSYKDKTWLEQERELYKSQGQLDKYAQEYLNVPLDESNGYFRKPDFGRMDVRDKDRTVHYYLSADLAVSTKQRSDWSVLIVSGMDSEGNLYILDVLRERLDSLEIINEILALNKRYDFEFGVFEKGAITASILPMLNLKMRETNNFITVHTINPAVDKVTRAQSIRARMRSGSVKFDHQADWYQTFELEALRFPRDLHDDQVDALSLLGLALEQFVEAPTQQELAQDIYDLEIVDSGLYEQGRSNYTGY